MASPGPEVFSRGFRFDPKPFEVVSYYLPRLIAGAPLHVAMRPFVHHADIYSCEPGELARMFHPLPKTGERFFFTSCKLQPQRGAAGKKPSKAMRAAGAGSWHSQGSKDVLDHDKANKVGEIRNLRFKKGGKYTDWLMEEYCCCLQEAVAGDRQLVFCKIYVSPKARQDSVAHQESAAFFAPPAPSPVVMAQAAAAAAPKSKRPAPPVAKPPCPKRMRVPVAPSHPVVQPPRLPCLPHHGVAPPSVTPSSPAPTHLAMQAHAPPRPLGQHKQQQMPPPTPPVVHMPVQAPACHRQPQPSVHMKQTILEPFKAMGDEADDEGESPAALQDDDEWDDLEKCMEEIVPTAEAEEEEAANSEEGSAMTDDEMDQQIFAALLENEIEQEIPDAIA